MNAIMGAFERTAKYRALNWQHERKPWPHRMILGPDAAAMLLNDQLADRQSQSGATLFRAAVRGIFVKDPAEALGCNSGTGIRDVHPISVRCASTVRGAPALAL